MYTLKFANFMLFLSTLSLRRATAPWLARLASSAYFYPRSPCGERQKMENVLGIDSGISIHALLAESDYENWQKTLETRIISIHALLAESDFGKCRCWVLSDIISIHALLAESDAVTTFGAGSVRNFYPRSPCGERPRPIPAVTRVANFYPRSPCGERHCTSIGRPKRLYFYPRSPCGERRKSHKHTEQNYKFLSTLSLRRATLWGWAE